MKTHILVDLDRCVGCYACEIACKQENELMTGIKWIELKKIGPVEVEGVMRMDYFPVMNRECTLCSHRSGGPACVEACPTKALKHCDEAEALSLLFNEKRYHVCRIP